MYCKKCGNELDEKNLTCPSCGEKYSDETSMDCKISVWEKILRFLNILVIILTLFVGVVDVVTSNIIGGIIMIAITVLIIIFIFSKGQMKKIKRKIRNPIVRKITVTLIYLLLPIIMFLGIGIGARFESSDPDMTAKIYAENVLEESLKNPQSLQVHDSKISTEFEYGGYYYYHIKIDYSAQNGFGGYNRNTYELLVKVSKQSNIAYEVTSEEYSKALNAYMAEKYKQ